MFSDAILSRGFLRSEIRKIFDIKALLPYFSVVAKKALNFLYFITYLLWINMLFFILQANIIRLEVPVEKLNGLEAEYREEYDDLNSVPAKAFVDEFVNEVCL